MIAKEREVRHAEFVESPLSIDEFATHSFKAKSHNNWTGE